MARGTQLSQLISDLKAETGNSTLVSVGVDARPAAIALIKRTQDFLYYAHDWPFLRVTPFKSMAAGQRYYDFPTELNEERIEEVVYWYNGTPTPIERGIGWEEYSSQDSDNDERQDPVLKWDLRRTAATTTQIEVWPIPAANASTGPSHNRLQFKGLRPLGALVDDSDTAYLDDHLIILSAAAEILARQESKDAPAKLSLANQRLAQLKGRLAGGSGMVVMGGSVGMRKHTGTVIRIGG